MTPRMRTIQEAAAELKRIDPDTAVTPYFIRRMVLSGDIPHIQAGNKRLVNLDTLLDYLAMTAAVPLSHETPSDCGKIRPIREA